MASSEFPELLTAHSSASADPLSPLEREPALVVMLEEAERRVDRVLDDMPPAFVDARRLIGRELWPLPRPEVLQTIIKIAADKDAEGPRRNLPRRFLALRLVAEDLTRAFWDPMLLDPGAIWCRAEDLRAVVEAVERLEAVLEPGQGGSSDVAFEDRVYLKTVAHALAPRRELIAAAITLAPHLIEIMEVAGVDDLHARIPSLTPEEAEILRRTAAMMGAGEEAPPSESDEGTEEPVQDPGADPARRHIGLEVLTVRWLIHVDVAEWEELFREAAEMQPELPAEADGRPTDVTAPQAGPSSPDGASPAAQNDDEASIWLVDENDADRDSAANGSPEPAPPGRGAAQESMLEPGSLSRRALVLTPEQAELRQHIHQRALRHQVLYGVVSERLQKIQDEALLMRQKETTEWLAAFRRPLVSSYSRLLTVVRKQVPGAPTPEALIVPDDEPGETVDEIFEKAVSRVDEKKAAEEDEKTAQPERRARRARAKRIALMAVVLLGLSGVAVGVRFLIPKPPPDPLVFSPDEARNVISLSETRPIGTMLYAKLSGQWDPFSQEECEREMVSLARIAMERGFTSIYLVDGSGEPLASWDQANGPKIFSPPEN